MLFSAEYLVGLSFSLELSVVLPYRLDLSLWSIALNACVQQGLYGVAEQSRA